jgi:hypothetical protein
LSKVVRSLLSVPRLRREDATMLDVEQCLVFQGLIEEAGFETRSYSGRGMYGKTCLGVDLEGGNLGRLLGDLVEMTATSDDPGEAVEIVAEGLRSMQTDSMGRGMIVYFEEVSYDGSGAEPTSDCCGAEIEVRTVDGHPNGEHLCSECGDACGPVQP